MRRLDYWTFKICGFFSGVKSFPDEQGDIKYMLSLDYFGGRQNLFVSEQEFKTLENLQDGSEGRIFGRVEHKPEGVKFKVQAYEFSGLSTDFQSLTDAELEQGSAFCGPGFVLEKKEYQTQKSGYGNNVTVKLLGATTQIKNVPQLVFAQIPEKDDVIFRGVCDNHLINEWDGKKRFVSIRMELRVLAVSSFDDSKKKK